MKLRLACACRTGERKQRRARRREQKALAGISTDRHGSEDRNTKAPIECTDTVQSTDLGTEVRVQVEHHVTKRRLQEHRHVDSEHEVGAVQSRSDVHNPALS